MELPEAPKTLDWQSKIANPKSRIDISILYAGKFGGKVARHKTRSKPRTEIAFESSLRHCPQKQKSAD